MKILKLNIILLGVLLVLLQDSNGSKEQRNAVPLSQEKTFKEKSEVDVANIQHDSVNNLISPKIEKTRMKRADNETIPQILKLLEGLVPYIKNLNSTNFDKLNPMTDKLIEAIKALGSRNIANTLLILQGIGKEPLKNIEQLLCELKKDLPISQVNEIYEIIKAIGAEPLKNVEQLLNDIKKDTPKENLIEITQILKDIKGNLEYNDDDYDYNWLNWILG